jgi:hypothetical protein
VCSSRKEKKSEERMGREMEGLIEGGCCDGRRREKTKGMDLKREEKGRVTVYALGRGARLRIALRVFHL